MKLNFYDMILTISYALDCIENEELGIKSNHSKRIAYLTAIMANEIEVKDYEKLDLIGYALLHDNAVKEYISEEFNESEDNVINLDKGSHCVIGQKNIEFIPFYNKLQNIILYHHENADGSGVFGKTADEIHIYSQLIHLADNVDLFHNLEDKDISKWKEVFKYLDENTGTLFTKQCVDIFKKALTEERVNEILNNDIDTLLQKEMPKVYREYSIEEIHDFCEMFARVIDYKSEQTSNHSIGVAEKAADMGRYYKFDEEKVLKLYFAGAFHDIGKLVVDRDVLEKESKLTDNEFAHIQKHAYYTHELLSKMEGIDDIVKWASHHHEKLNGNGYPFGLTADQLSFEERLMGCIDIYQALTEKRSYKEGMPHSKAIDIMKDMAKKDFIDMQIVEDIDERFTV